jgi:hypothetical protein
MTLVAGQEPEHRGKARTRRRWGAVAASLLAHGVVFAVIGFNAPKLIAPPMAPQTADVWLIPRLTPQAHKLDEHRAAAARRAPLSTTVKPAPAPAAHVPPPQPAPPQPAQGAAAVPGKGAPAAGRGTPAPAAQGIEDGLGAQQALRTSVGCDYDRLVRLNPGEKDRCNQTFGAEAKKGRPFNGIDIAKRARFDAQAEADDRRRALREGSMPQVVACDGPGADDHGGCLPPSAIAHIPIH